MSNAHIIRNPKHYRSHNAALIQINAGSGVKGGFQRGAAASRTQAPLELKLRVVTQGRAKDQLTTASTSSAEHNRHMKTG
jgi:hypothetical protein